MATGLRLVSNLLETGTICVIQSLEKLPKSLLRGVPIKASDHASRISLHDFPEAGFEQLGELMSKNRSAEIVTLRLVTFGEPEEIPSLLAFPHPQQPPAA